MHFSKSRQHYDNPPLWDLDGNEILSKLKYETGILLTACVSLVTNKAVLEWIFSDTGNLGALFAGNSPAYLLLMAH